MDGLMDVAEAIRKDLPKAKKDSNISSPSKSSLMLPDADKKLGTMGAGVFSTKSAILEKTGIKQKFTDLASLKTGHITDKYQGIYKILCIVILSKFIDITKLDYVSLILLILS